MIGKTIAQYEVLDKLGEGGMGVVYKARDTRLDRIVALKFLPAHVGGDEAGKQRFLNEAKAASALDHSNICSIFSIEQTDEGTLFIVMAYYEGMSLKQKIDQGPLSIKEAVNYAIQMASGLQKAHRKRIVHRDLKPDNIFITVDDQVKIIDFGLARAAGQELLTKTGTTLGTAPYMSPEQAQGAAVDHRTDIWSLGVVMYEMVTGRRPFESEYESALVYSILNEDPEPVTGLRSGVPMELERVIDKCLDKDPAARYQHTDEIIVDLRKVESQPVSGTAPRPAGARKRTERSDVHEAPTRPAASKGKKTPAMLGAVFVLAIIIAIFLYRPFTGVSEGPGQLSLRQVTFAAGVDEFPAWSPDGTQLAFSREAGGYRNIFIKDLETGDERQITHTRADNIQPAWSPDGASLLFVRANQPHGRVGISDVFFGWNEDGDIWKMDLDTENEVKFIENAFHPSYSPDGNWIAVDASWAGSRRLWMVDDRGRNPRQISTDVSEAVVHTAPKWSPDGSKIVFQHIEGTKRDVRMIDRASGRMTWITNDHFPNIQPFWSPGGDKIYFSSYRGGGMNIWRIAAADGAGGSFTYEQMTTGAGQDLNVSLSPDGKQIAFSVLGINSDLWLLPVSPETGRPAGEPRQLIETTREDSRGAWSPDGTMVAFNSDRTGDMNIWLHTLEDGSTRQLTTGPGGDYQPNWSPDGEWITFFSSRAGHLDIWSMDVATGTLRQLTDRSASDINPFFSPNGEHIAFYSDERGRSEPWVMKQDGSGIRPMASMYISGHFLRWSPDGKNVIFPSPDEHMGGLWSVPITGGTPEFYIEPAGGGHISFSPDFSLIMDVIDHKTLWATPLDGSEPYSVFEFEDPEVRIDYPVWSPDGNYVLFDHYRPSGGNIWIAEGF